MSKCDQGKRSQTIVDANHEDKDIQDYEFKHGFIILTSSHNKRSTSMPVTNLGQKKNPAQYVQCYENFYGMRVSKEAMA